jgi:hypothetical protein
MSNCNHPEFQRLTFKLSDFGGSQTYCGVCGRNVTEEIKKEAAKEDLSCYVHESGIYQFLGGEDYEG